MNSPKLIKYTDVTGRIFFLTDKDLTKTDGEIPLRNSLGEVLNDLTQDEKPLTIPVATARAGKLEPTGLDSHST